MSQYFVNATLYTGETPAVFWTLQNAMSSLLFYDDDDDAAATTTGAHPAPCIMEQVLFGSKAAGDRS